MLGDFSVLTKGLPKVRPLPRRQLMCLPCGARNLKPAFRRQAQFGRQKKKPDQPPDPETTTDVWRKIRTVPAASPSLALKWRSRGFALL